MKLTTLNLPATLNIFNEVCIKNYKTIKENRSDEVVRYFESQLRTANQQLKTAEDKLLAFNKENNIINYYEQSKAVAVVKEDMVLTMPTKRLSWPVWTQQSSGWKKN